MSLTACSLCRRGCLLDRCDGGGYRGCSGGSPSGWHPCGGILAWRQGGPGAVRSTRSAQSVGLPRQPSSNALHAKSPAKMACRTCPSSRSSRRDNWQNQKWAVVGKRLGCHDDSHASQCIVEVTTVVPATFVVLQRLLMSAGCPAASLTLVAGTAGIVERHLRKARREKDAGLARALLTDGLPAFVQTWYQQPMWQSLRAHARYIVFYCLPSRSLRVSLCWPGGL